MARNENDVTDGRDDGENRAAQRGRKYALEGDAMPSADAIGDAVAKAMDRQRNAPKEPAKPLPEIVRASVRCGYETTRRVLSDGSSQMVTSAAAIAFKANETADGKPCSVVHGRPVHLKREAFERYRRDGKVLLAQ